MYHKENFAAYQVELLAKLFSNKIDQSFQILDFGCGDGVMAHYVNRAFFKATVIGIDQDESKLNHARQDYSEIRFESLKSSALPFEANSFDLIYAAQVFHHIALESHPDVANELLRVLKPGGYLVIFELNPYNVFIRRAFNKNPFEKDAAMIKPSRVKALFPNQKASFLYFGYPNLLQWLSGVLQFLPFGQLYVALIKKNSR